jgi:hypothetical protein
MPFISELIKYVNFGVAISIFFLWTFQLSRSLYKYLTSHGDHRHRLELIWVHIALVLGNSLYLLFEFDTDGHILTLFYIMQLFLSVVQIYSFNLVCQDSKEPVS